MARKREELKQQTETVAEVATETPTEAPKKRGPIDYVEKAIQLLEGEQEEHYRGNYHTALKMLAGSKIFIRKELEKE